MIKPHAKFFYKSGDTDLEKNMSMNQIAYYVNGNMKSLDKVVITFHEVPDKIEYDAYLGDMR